MKKKLTFLLVFALVLSMIPTAVLFAEDNDSNGEYNDYYNDNDVDAYEESEESEENDVDDADENDSENGDEADEDHTNDENGDNENGDEDYDEADNDEDYDEENNNENDGNNEDENDDPENDGPIEITPISLPLTTLRFVIGETTFTRNGIPAELDAAPFIDAAVGRTMVPLAAIAEGLGATVAWDGESRNVSILRGDVELVLNIDTELPDGMGNPVMVEGRTFVPLAYVANMLGATTRWDPDAQAVYIEEQQFYCYKYLYLRGVFQDSPLFFEVLC